MEERLMKIKLFEGKTAFLPFFLLCTLLFGACGAPAITDTTADDTTEPITAEVTEVKKETVKISAIGELNTDAAIIDSHAGEFSGSSIELDYRNAVSIRATALGTNTAFYPRIKKLSDGSFILFYNTGQTGPSIMYMKSADGVEWGKAKPLAESENLAGGDRTLYATADAVELQNGDLLVAYSYRTEKTYTKDLSKSGIALRISKDKGETWSEPKTIYVGMNWEPHLLQDKNGTIYCTFTHTAPYVHLYGYNNTIRSSGAAIVRSTDNGETWTPEVTGAPYTAQRVMQSYIGMLDGRKIFNDQMPVMLQLNSGKLMLACESLQLDKKFFISIGYSDDGWAKELGLEEIGPVERSTNLFRGAGPYLAQFPSGETVLSYANNSFLVKLGNAEGKDFGTEDKPFASISSTVMWGTLEKDTDHSVYAAYEDKRTVNNSSITFITYGKLYLNHRINAKNMSAPLTADPADWTQNTDALFIGSVSQAQSAYRFAYDGDKITVLTERLDRKLCEDDKDILFLAAEGATEFLKITVNAEGVDRVQHYNGKTYESVDKDKIAFAVNTVTVGNKDSHGYVVEITFDKSLVPGLAEVLMFNAQLTNVDDGEKFENDTFGLVSMTDVSTWQTVFLK